MLYPKSLPAPEALANLDPEEWQQLHQQLAPLIALWCTKVGVPRHEIDDIAQEVLVYILRHVRRFRPNGRPGCFQAWVKRVTERKAVDLFRRRANRPRPIGYSLSRFPASAAVDPENERPGKRAAHNALGPLLRNVRCRFTQRSWTAFWQTTVEERACEHVAVDLHMSSGAVRVCKCRVLAALRRELSTQGYEEARAPTENVKGGQVL